MSCARELCVGGCWRLLACGVAVRFVLALPGSAVEELVACGRRLSEESCCWRCAAGLASRLLGRTVRRTVRGGLLCFGFEVFYSAQDWISVLSWVMEVAMGLLGLGLGVAFRFALPGSTMEELVVGGGCLGVEGVTGFASRLLG